MKYAVFWVIKNQFVSQRKPAGQYYVRFKVFTAVTTKNAVFWDVATCGFCGVFLLLVTVNVVPSSPILATLMMEEMHFSKRSFLQNKRGETSQRKAFFI
jgi:hypothetical protein